MDKILLTVKETMQYLGLGESQTRFLIKNESFGCRIGYRLYSNKVLLDKWLDNCCTNKKQKSLK